MANRRALAVELRFEVVETGGQVRWAGEWGRKRGRRDGSRMVGRRVGRGSGSMGKRGWLNIVGVVRVGVGVGERGAEEVERGGGVVGKADDRRGASVRVRQN